MTEKQMKRRIHGNRFSAWIVTANVFEDLALESCQRLLGRALEHKLRKPYLELKDLKFREILQLTLASTLCQDIYWVIHQRNTDTIGRFQRLFEESLLPLILAKGTDIGVRIKSYESRLYHEARLKESAQKMLTTMGYNPIAWKDAPNKLLITIRDNQASLGLSMAGQALYQRGYRSSYTAAAPMAEHLAATLIRKALVLTDQEPNIYVPYAGTGTLGFETAILLKDMAGLWPRRFACEDWRCLPEKTHSFLKSRQQENASRKQSQEKINILFVDQNESAIRTLEANTKSFLAPLVSDQWHIEIRQDDATSLLDLPFNQEQSLFIPINPPWGERLSIRNPEALFRKTASVLNQLPQKLISGFIIAPNDRVLAGFTQELKRSFKTSVFSFYYGGSQRQVCIFKT